MNARLLFSLAAAATLAACAGPGAGAGAAPHAGAGPAGAAGAAPSEFYPLAVGNEWTYRDESPGLRQPGSTRTVRILSRTKDGYFKDTDRGELRADVDCLHDRSRRLLCAPIRKGSSWTSVVSVSSTEKYEIVGVGERLVTPAGTFDGCVRVRGHNRASATAEMILEITYAPGIGPAKIETFVLVKGDAIPQFRAVLENVKVKVEGR
jgi:hypothetical protein